MGKSKSKKSNMTKEQFKKKLDECRMSYSEFSNLIGYHHQTVKQWQDGDIPYFVEIVFDYLQLVMGAFEQITLRKKSSISINKESQKGKKHE